MEAYIYDAVRTPRGLAKPTGALAQVHALELLNQLYAALLKRTSIPIAAIDDLILGCVTQIGEQGGNVARASALYANLPGNIPALTINRFCSSSLDATGLAAERIQANACAALLTGGVESMSRVSAFSDKPAWMLEPALSVKTRSVPIGIGADLVASLQGFTRHDLDLLAQQSQQRAQRALEHGYFTHAVVPIETPDGQVVSSDEGVRGDVTLTQLAQLKPLFQELGAQGIDQALLQFYPHLGSIEHLHTVASAPSMVDAASLLLVGNNSVQNLSGSSPRARIVGYASCCGPVTEVLTGASAAVRMLLNQCNVTMPDIDLIEYNESYAAPTLKFLQDFKLDHDSVNVNGGAMSLGHPMGATGGVLIATLLDELERRDKSLGLVAISGATGMGSALLIERC